MYIFDCEVFKCDWLFVFKDLETGEYTVIHNDNAAVKGFMTEDKVIAGFNNKWYDNHILKAILCDADNETVKEINDFIIGGRNGWEHPFIQSNRCYFDSFDLMDDMQQGLSLKAIEAHLGINIKESDVDFNIDRPLTEDEIAETISYCKWDVDSTERLFRLRENYLQNKLTLGRAKGISDTQALYMTNAKLTAKYLDAQKPDVEYTDERNYTYPDNLLREYIPQEVFDFFDKLHDRTIPDEVIFASKYEFKIGECECTVAYGGIHGAIPCYREKATDNRSIRNQDVASYYPHLMTLDGYCSRNIPDPEIYAVMLEKRMLAKKRGDKATANALKLVANTTYGAMLNKYNDLYDPLMGRSVCITGQLRLLELTFNLVAHCPTLKVIQLNTDGIMVSLDNSDLASFSRICKEWQERTGFELEEDCIKEIVQKDVNNYIEVAMDGGTKIKGGQLVRGIAPAGAFNINNNATIVAQAILDYFVNDTPVETTINECQDILAFQLVAKVSSKYTYAFHIVNGEKVPIQRCNRVYASPDMRHGTLYKVHATKSNDNKIAGLPDHCVIDNENHLTVNDIDKKWYIRLAKKYIKDFLGIVVKKPNGNRIRAIKRRIAKALGITESEIPPPVKKEAPPPIRNEDAAIDITDYRPIIVEAPPNPTIEIGGLVLEQTSAGCPEQYNVFNYKGEKVAYLRLRHGCFRADCPNESGEMETIWWTYDCRGDGSFYSDERLYFLKKAVKEIKKHIMEVQNAKL